VSPFTLILRLFAIPPPFGSSRLITPQIFLGYDDPSFGGNIANVALGAALAQ
jgi:hypothetical protein